MKTILINDLTDSETVTAQELAAVKGGYQLENVYVTSYSVSGATSARFRRGVYVATGDVNNDGVAD